MPPAMLFFTMCDRTNTPENHASSLPRTLGPKSKKLQHTAQSFLWLYAKSSRDGVTSSLYITIFKRCPWMVELKKALNSGQSSQHTHSIAIGCKNGRLMQPPPFVLRLLVWIRVPNGVLRPAKAWRFRCMVDRLVALIIPCFFKLSHMWANAR